MIYVHTTMLERDLARGYVVVDPAPAGWGERALLAHPNDTCLRQLRTGLCTMDKDHRGRCSTVTFNCDSCGKTRRGHYDSCARDSDGEIDVVFCWFCTNVLYPRPY